MTTDEAVKTLEERNAEVNSDVYVGLLVARLALLTTELDARRREHSSVVHELDKSRKISSELKKHLTTTKTDLLNCQQRHLAELSRITSMLTDRQKDELAQIAEKDLVSGDNLIIFSKLVIYSLTSYCNVSQPFSVPFTLT